MQEKRRNAAYSKMHMNGDYLTRNNVNRSLSNIVNQLKKTLYLKELAKLSDRKVPQLKCYE
jgi:hypothetical protein